MFVINAEKRFSKFSREENTSSLDANMKNLIDS